MGPARTRVDGAPARSPRCRRLSDHRLVGCVEPPPALRFDPEELPRARAGTAYEARIRIEDNVTPVGGMSVSAGALPPGLELAVEQPQGRGSELISGVPDAPGTYRFTVSVWCYGTQVSGQTASREYALVVE